MVRMYKTNTDFQIAFHFEKSISVIKMLLNVTSSINFTLALYL